jgi:TolB-like protein/Tfp pilus assembly protein PilF
LTGTIANMPGSYRFGHFVFDPRPGELRKNGRKIRLEGQPARILARLLERPGELISRDALRKELWPEGTHVNFEHSLNAAVKRLRRALGDSPAGPVFIETLARRGYRFIAPVTSPASAASARAPAFQTIDSLAVLPFENLSGDPDIEYLGDGLTESIINSLSQAPSVQVMARSTVFRYKNKAIDPRVAGRKLNVRAVLMGRILQRGRVLTIGAELVEAQNGWSLWGAQYDRDSSDILGVAEEISKEVCEKLRWGLTGDQRDRLAKRHTGNTEAYQDYLKGRYHWNRVNEEGLQRSIEYFEAAIRKDPEYAVAHAGLADSYSLLAFFGLRPPAELIPKAKAAALRALEIDDRLAEAHAALAGILKTHEWDWQASEREFLRSLDLNPHYSPGRRGYAALLAAMGRSIEGMREIRRAHELDPLSLWISMEIAWHLYMAREYDGAVEQAERTIELEPEFVPARHVLGLAYEQKGLYEQARTELERAAAGSGGHAATLAGIGRVLAQTGLEDQARAILTRWSQLAEQSYVSAFWPSIVYAALGDKEAALSCLEQACDQRDPYLVWLRTDPRLDSLRAEPRFESLLRRVGLASQWSAAVSAQSGQPRNY